MVRWRIVSPRPPPTASTPPPSATTSLCRLHVGIREEEARRGTRQENREIREERRTTEPDSHALLRRLGEEEATGRRDAMDVKRRRRKRKSSRRSGGGGASDNQHGHGGLLAMTVVRMQVHADPTRNPGFNRPQTSPVRSEGGRSCPNGPARADNASTGVRVRA